jgi:hypothetical protein
MEKLRFWFDLENAPDVLFFEPIYKKLKNTNHEVYVTCRDYVRVPELAKIYGMDAQTAGVYGGKAMIMKYVVGVSRSIKLGAFSLRKKIDLAVGFGSRPLALTCKMLGIRNASVIDYEHVAVSALNKFCDFVYVPDLVSLEIFINKGLKQRKLRTFPGLKEDVYVSSYKNSGKELYRRDNKINVLIRPSASTAHYHNQKSEIILKAILDRIRDDKDVNAVFLERGRSDVYQAYMDGNIKVLEKPAKGLDLIQESDVVISGGGTMVREAAVMGVPSYSIFTGELGAVDKKLAEEGRVHLIREPEDIGKIRFQKNKGHKFNQKAATHTLDFFVNEFIKLAQKQ